MNHRFTSTIIKRENAFETRVEDLVENMIYIDR